MTPEIPGQLVLFDITEDTMSNPTHAPTTTGPDPRLQLLRLSNTLESALYANVAAGRPSPKLTRHLEDALSQVARVLEDLPVVRP